jgi:hypothetical protein
MVHVCLKADNVIFVLQARPSCSRSSGISTDNKKRKSEDNSEANSKKPKHQSSTPASKVRYEIRVKKGYTP